MRNRYKKILCAILSGITICSSLTMAVHAEDVSLEMQTLDQVIEENGEKTLFGEVILEDSESGPVIEENAIMLLTEYTGYRDWKWPVPDSDSLSSCYIDGRSHYAIDIAAPKGTAVYASYPGTVIGTSAACSHNYGKSGSCGCNGGMGNYVFIKHTYMGVDFVSRYIHLTKVNVSTGDSVTADTIIGTVGSTGSSRGFHLDYKIYQGSTKTSSNSTSLDPLKCQFLDIPEGLNANSASTSCCYTYVREVKAIYADPITAPDENPPVISDVKISADAAGYTITCTVTDESEIDRVQFPTWTSDINGQDDLDTKWVTSEFSSGSISGQTVTYRVNRSDHNDEMGKYITDIYAYDIYGNHSCVRVTYTFDANMLPFIDVSTDDWYYDSISYVYKNEIMNGVSLSKFCPEEMITRGQFAVMLYRLENSPEVTYTEEFTDVPDEQWYTNGIIWASENGIVKGYSEGGLFGVEDGITREQMALMMYRYANYKGFDTSTRASLENFADADKVNEFAKEAMKWAVGSKIINGKNATTLDPLGTALRGECATIFMRFIKAY